MSRPGWPAAGGAPRPGRSLAPALLANGVRFAPGIARRWSPSVYRSSDPFSFTSLAFGSSYHTPVMVEEVLRYLRPDRGGVFLDGTLGGGGHSEAILEASTVARVLGVDRDPEARAEAATRLARFGDRFELLSANFAAALDVARIGEGELSGVLLDLGISSHQIDASERGFTFRSGAPLDMRMEGQGGGATAAEILNEESEERLADIFYHFGEERRSRRLARAIVERRAADPFARSEQLVEVIDRSIPRATAQDRARIFQALRIAVNGEIEALERALPRFRDALAVGGVMVVLSYHSLEDRIVKDAFREWSRDCVCPPGLPICHCRGHALGTQLTRKPLMAGEEEVAANSRARSARLRAWRKS
jgi:16S rRNA (cytosine1402-N4)-methyltransferase